MKSITAMRNQIKKKHPKSNVVIEKRYTDYEDRGPGINYSLYVYKTEEDWTFCKSQMSYKQLLEETKKLLEG